MFTLWLLTGLTVALLVAYARADAAIRRGDVRGEGPLWSAPVLQMCAANMAALVVFAWLFGRACDNARTLSEALLIGGPASGLIVAMTGLS